MKYIMIVMLGCMLGQLEVRASEEFFEQAEGYELESLYIDEISGQKTLYDPQKKEEKDRTGFAIKLISIIQKEALKQNVTAREVIIDSLRQHGIDLPDGIESNTQESKAFVLLAQAEQQNKILLLLEEPR